jgi:hypothetical protein
MKGSTIKKLKIVQFQTVTSSAGSSPLLGEGKRNSKLRRQSRMNRKRFSVPTPKLESTK